MLQHDELSLIELFSAESILHLIGKVTHNIRMWRGQKILMNSYNAMFIFAEASIAGVAYAAYMALSSTAR